MSRFRRSDDDLAYGDIPQRWDRDRFERFNRGGGGGGRGSRYEDDFRYVERDSPGRRDIAVMEREKSRGPGGRFEERDSFFESDRTTRPRRRTDRELFGEMDPREIAEMAVTPYRRRSVTREDVDVRERGPRPGLLRRQSSLDTFDRRPAQYEREERRIPPYTPVPLPIRRERRDYEDYREVEIERERSVHRRRAPKSEAGRSIREEVKSIAEHKSDSSSSISIHAEEERVSISGGRAKSTIAPSHRTRSVRAPSIRAPSIHEEIHETEIREIIRAPSIHESVRDSVHESAFEASVREERRFKKGKTRMPKRLVRQEAIMDLGYPFDEEEDFFVLRIALEKEQIDEVMQISETYRNGDAKKVYRYEEKIEESAAIPAPPIGQHEVVERTEWINPPTVVGGQHSRSRSRRPSPSAKSSISQRHHSRRPSSPGTFVEERKTIIEERGAPSAYRAPSAPPPPEFFEERKTIIEERSPRATSRAGTLVLAERDTRTDRDINAEIRALEAEQRALRYEREADEKRDLALRIREQRPEEELQLVEYRDRPRTEILELVERDRSPARNVVRVEKDRKGRLALVRSAH